ncbi:MAG: tetratricopeptide repeat protein [Marinobacter sp.]
MSYRLRLILASAILFPAFLLSACDNQTDSSGAASHINRADTYADQGQFRSALIEVRNAIQAEPENVDHIVKLAEFYLEMGAAGDAAELLAPWLNDYPGSVSVPLARAYIEQGKHLSAKEALEQHADYTPEQEFEASLIRAEALRLSGNPEEALARFRELMKSDESSVAAATGTLEALLTLSRTSQAIETADEWLARNQDEPSVLYWKGYAQYLANQLEPASATLTDAVAALPSADIFMPIRRNILTTLSRVLTEQGKITEAQVYNRVLAENTNSEARERSESAIEAIARGELDEARKTLEDLMRQDPDNQIVGLTLGMLNLQEGRKEEALALLDENLDAEITPTPFIRAAMMAKIDSGKREEALATLSRAVASRPNDVDLLAMHGLLALSLPSHSEEGIASLSKALDLDSSRSRLRLALAQHYMQQGKQEQALGQLRVALTESPTDWPVTQYYLSVLLNHGQEAEAKDVKDSLLNGFADEPRAVTLAAMTEYRLGDVETARSRLEEQIQSDPDNATALATLALVYQGEGENEKAVSALVKAALLSPDSLGPIQGAGRLYARDNDPDEVVSWLKGIAEEHPELAVNSTALAAQIQVQQGKLTEARRLLEKIAEEDQNDTATQVEGQLLAAEAGAAASNENWPEARAKAAEAAALQPENLRFALVPVNIYGQEGKYQDALSSLEELESVHGENTAIDLMRARLLASSEGQEEAWNYLQSRWQETQEPQLLPVLVGLARVRSPDDVDELTRAWVEAQPESATARLSRAEYQMTSGDESGAIASYQAAIGYQPDNPVALNNLAWLLREKEPEQAINLASRAQKLAPENAAILDTYGWILHLAGRHEDAKPLIEKALDLSPDNEEIQGHLDAVNQAL